MKTIRLTSLLCSILLFASCEDDAVKPVDLTGDWQSEEIHVNGKAQAAIGTSTWLLLKENQLFQRNYVIGKWSVENGKLSLSPNQDLAMPSLQYKIIAHTENTLTLQLNVTEREYNWDFEDIEADERITITEKYSRR